MLCIQPGCKREQIVRELKLTTDSVWVQGQNWHAMGSMVDLGSRGFVEDHGLCWSLHPQPKLEEGQFTSLGIAYQEKGVRSQMMGLLPDTTYFIRTWAKDEGGHKFGNTLSFHSSLFDVETIDALQVGNNSLCLKGIIHRFGTFSFKSQGFCWSQSSSTPEIGDMRADLTPLSDTLEVTIPNLPNGTQVWYRAFVEEENGMIRYGQAKSAIIGSPLVTTGLISPLFGVGLPAPTISGSINVSHVTYSDHGHCYTEENRPPTVEDPKTSLGPGQGNKSFACSLAQLAQGKSYSIRAYAQKDNGEIIYGETVVFDAFDIWVQKYPLNVAQFYVKDGVVMGDKAYFWSGTSLIKWDPVTNLMYEESPFPGREQKGAILFAIDPYFYVLEDKTRWGSNEVPFWRFDSRTNTWEALPDYPFDRILFGFGLSIEGKALIGSHSFSTFTGYDPQSTLLQPWRPQPAFPPAPVSGVTAIATIDKVYIGPGTRDNTNWRGFWSFTPYDDQNSPRWEKEADYPGKTTHYNFGFGMNGKVYVASWDREFWAYDSRTRVWERGADLPNSPSNYVVAFSIGDKGYITIKREGFSSGYTHVDIWEYWPRI